MAIRKMPWPAYFWPGLPQLARDGNWAALAVAVAAAVVLNGLLLTTFVWSDVIGPAPRIIGWSLVGALWVGAPAYWIRDDRRRLAIAKHDGKTFEDAQAEYLKGNWFAAERKLIGLMRRDEHDIEARLLLATLLRHTKRFDEATNQLNLLTGFDGAHRWALEIHREGELLIEGRKQFETEPEAK